MILADPGGRERKQLNPEQQMQIHPQNPAIHTFRGMEQMMMVVPVDADMNEAEDIA
jgi:hypothetical protein